MSLQNLFTNLKSHLVKVNAVTASIQYFQKKLQCSLPIKLASQSRALCMLWQKTTVLWKCSTMEVINMQVQKEGNVVCD